MNTTTIDQQLKTAQAKGLDRLDAHMLLLHSLGRSAHDRAWLLSHDTAVLANDQQITFDRLIQRRLAGEPTAYLVGSKAFFGLNFNVDARVLVPRPDTECLVKWAMECLAPLVAPNVVDLGTGSGAIGLAIKQNCLNARVTLVDVSQAALDVALGNADSLGLSVCGLQSDWFGGIPSSDRFDLIVSNPPYIADGDAHLAALVHEPLMALASGADGLNAIRRIVQGAPHYLNPGGWLLLEHGYDQEQAVRDLLIESSFDSVRSRTDLNGIQRCTGGTLKSSF